MPVWCVPLAADSALIYAPYHGISTLVNRASVDRVRGCLRDETAEIPDGMDWIGALRNPANVPSARQGDPDPLYLGLIPTRACTMQCAYCDFAADHVYPLMSFEMIRRAVDGYAALLEKNGAASWEMHFFGGEPFAAFKEIVFALNYARRKADWLGLPAHFEVTTNGFYSEEKSRWIADNFDTVVLSFDGFPETQDRHRPAPGGRDSFMMVCRNADIFARGNCELIIRSCVSAGNTDELPEWAAFIAERFFPASVVLEPMIASPLSARNGLNPPDPDAFVRSWTTAYRVLRKARIPLIYSSGEIDTLKTSLCPMGQDALIVTPDGQIGGCWQLAENRRIAGIDLGFGTVSDGGLQIDRDALDRQRALSESNRYRCRSCFCYAHCAGGCLLKGEQNTGFCRMTRALTLWQLLEQLGCGLMADGLLEDKAFLDRLADTDDFDCFTAEFPAENSTLTDPGQAGAEPDISYRRSGTGLPQLPADAERGWIRDGSRILLTDPGKDFVKVLDGEEALRFRLDHSGMTGQEIETVWMALREAD